MRRYYSNSGLLDACQKALDRFSPMRGESPLPALLQLLYQHRRYFWIGIYFVLGDQVVRQAMQGPVPPCHSFEFGKGNVGTTGQSGQLKVIPDVAADATYSMCFREVKSEMVVPIKVGGRTLGVIDVESDRLNNFACADRVLLEAVATMLALFLTGPGKVLLRHAKELQSATSSAMAAAK